MNDRPDVGARMTRWLAEEAPARAPERLVHATRQEIATTAQIGGLGAMRLRFPALSSRMGFVAGAIVAAAIVVIAAVSMTESRPSAVAHPGSGAGSPSPSRTASPFACPTGRGPCLGPLRPGNYPTRLFAPQVQYIVPAGWDNTLDSRGQVDLSYVAGGTYTYPDGITFHDGISIFRRPVAESASSKSPLIGIGKTARDLAQWLAGHADLAASGLTPVTVGGAPGYRIVIAIPTGPRKSPDHCTTDHGLPACESLFISDDPAAGYGFGIVGPESAVVYLVDAPSGDTVMVVIDDVDGVDRAGLIAAATPVVDSLVFSP